MPRSPNDEEHSTILQHRFAATDGAVGEFVLTVVAGVDAGLTTTLDGSAPVLLGKGSACGVRLTDPSVSRRHLSFDVAGRVLHVRDVGSTNGTFAGGVRVREFSVEHEAQFTVGDSLVHVEWRPSREGSAPMSLADRFGRVVGASREMRRLYPLFAKLTQSSIPVILEGETGTGKEILAESIHEKSARASQPFVVFDCTSTPANLIEAELYGYERGAFTGAAGQHRGVFEQAEGGTLLIDEIGDLPIAEQAKLLRIIERAEFRRLGGERPIRVDVRVIAATRRNLDQEIEAGRFRDDLFHRLAVARVELPPLRDRRGDVPILARHMWEHLGAEQSLPSELVARWERHDWPGNVRELRNAVARYVALGEGALDERQSTRANATFDALVDGILSRGLALAVARQHVVDEFERRYLERVLADNGGVVVRAAAAAGVARRHFHRLLTIRTSRRP